MNQAKRRGNFFDKCPLRSLSTAYRTVDGVSLVVGGAEGKLRSLNPTGTFIWEKSDGKHTLAEIVRLVCQAFAVDYAQAAHDAEFFVRELEGKDMLVMIENHDPEGGKEEVKNARLRAYRLSHP